MSDEKVPVHDLRDLLVGKSGDDYHSEHRSHTRSSRRYTSSYSRSRQRSRSYSPNDDSRRKRSSNYSRHHSHRKRSTSYSRSYSRRRRSESYSRYDHHRRHSRSPSSRDKYYSRPRSTRSRSSSPPEKRNNSLSGHEYSPLNNRDGDIIHSPVNERKWYKNLEVKVMNEQATKDDIKITVPSSSRPEKYLEECGISIEEIVKDVIASNNLSDSSRLLGVVAENTSVKRCLKCRKILQHKDQDYCKDCHPGRSHEYEPYQAQRKPLLVPPPIYSPKHSNHIPPPSNMYNPMTPPPIRYALPLPPPIPCYSNVVPPTVPRHYQAPPAPPYTQLSNAGGFGTSSRYVSEEGPSTSQPTTYQNVKRNIMRTIKGDSNQVVITRPKIRTSEQSKQQSTNQTALSPSDLMKTLVLPRGQHF